MSSSTARTLVLVAYLAMTALIGLNKSGKYTSNGSKYKAIWAASVFFLGLSVTADLAPQIAGPLALLAVIAVAVKNPGEIGPLAAGANTSAGSNATGTNTIAPQTGG